MKFFLFFILLIQVAKAQVSPPDFSSISSALPKLDTPIGNYQNIPAFNPLLDINENHGQFRTEIALPLPSNNLKFSLKLKYSSDSHKNYGMGQGWDWDLPVVEEIFAKNSLGEFKYYGLLGTGQIVKSDEDLSKLNSIIQNRFNISLEQEATQSYRSLVDENLLLFIQLKNSSRFLILTQEGKYFLIGKNGNLEKIRDYFGNAIDFSWEQNYLKSISSPVEGWSGNFTYTSDPSKQNSLPISYHSQMATFDKHLSNIQFTFSNQKKQIDFSYSQEGDLIKAQIARSLIPLFKGSYSSFIDKKEYTLPSFEDKKTLIFKDTLKEPERYSENDETLIFWTDLNNDGRTDRVVFFIKEYFDRIKKQYTSFSSRDDLEKILNQTPISSRVEFSVLNADENAFFQESSKLNLSALDIRPYKIKVEGPNNTLKFIRNRIEFIDLNNDGLKDLVYAEGLSELEDSSAASFIAHHFNPSFPQKGTDPFSQKGNMASVYLLTPEKLSLESFRAEFAQKNIHDSLSFLLPTLYEWQKSTLTFPCHQQTLFFDANNDGLIDVLSEKTLYLNKGTGEDFYSVSVTDPYSLFEEGDSLSLSSTDKTQLIDQNKNGKLEIIKGEKILRYPLTGKILSYSQNEGRFLETKSEERMLTQIHSPFGGMSKLSYSFIGGKWALSQIEQISSMDGIPNLKRSFNYFDSSIIDVLDGSFIGYSKTEEKIEQLENGKVLSEIPTKLITKTFSTDTNSAATFLFSRQRLSGNPLQVIESGLNTKASIITRHTWLNAGDEKQFIPYITKTDIEEKDEDGNIYRAKTLTTKKNFHFADHYFVYETKQTKGLGLHSDISSDFEEENALEIYNQYALIKDKNLILPLRTIKKDLSSPLLPTRNTDYSIDSRSGVISSIKENNERITDYRFDNLGRLTRIKNNRGSISSVAYQGNSTLPSQYIENDQAYTLSFDPFLSRPLSVTTPFGVVWSYSYSPEGITKNIVKTNPENGQNVLFFSQKLKDESDLTIWDIFFKGTAYTQELDTWGRAFATTTHGKRKLYSGKSYKTLDGKSLLETMPSYNGFTDEIAKNWAYDHLGRMIMSSDKLSGKTIETRYEKGLELRFTNGKQTEVTKETLTGKILSQERQGEKFSFSLNAFSELTGIKEFGEKWTYDRYGVSLSNQGTKPSWKDSRTFDSTGLIETRSDYDLVIQSDDKGRILKTSGSSPDSIFYQANFENDLLKNEVFTWGSDESQAQRNDYAYNSDGLIVELKTENDIQKWNYDNFGRVLTSSFGSYSYDASSITSLSPFISNIERDAKGNITSIQYANGLTASFNYESQIKNKIEVPNLLTIETKLNEDVQIKERMTKSALKEETFESFNYNPETLRFQSPSSRISFSRNPKGQVTSYNGKTFSWDGENLSKISGVGNFFYSPKGELQIAQLNGFTIKKLGNDSYSINDKIVRLVTIDKLAVGVLVDKRFFPVVSDHLGSIVSMFDESGKNLLWHRTYDAWGKKAVVYSNDKESRQLEQLCLWSFAHLKELPSLMNIYWSKSRVYSAEGQEWLSVDPLLKWNPNTLMNNPDNWMGTRYVNNDPLNFVDPSGYYNSDGISEWESEYEEALDETEDRDAMIDSVNEGFRDISFGIGVLATAAVAVEAWPAVMATNELISAKLSTKLISEMTKWGTLGNFAINHLDDISQEATSYLTNISKTPDATPPATFTDVGFLLGNMQAVDWNESIGFLMTRPFPIHMRNK